MNVTCRISANRKLCQLTDIRKKDNHVPIKRDDTKCLSLSCDKSSISNGSKTISVVLWPTAGMNAATNIAAITIIPPPTNGGPGTNICKRGKQDGMIYKVTGASRRQNRNATLTWLNCRNCTTLLWTSQHCSTGALEHCSTGALQQEPTKNGLDHVRQLLR